LACNEGASSYVRKLAEEAQFASCGITFRGLLSISAARIVSADLTQLAQNRHSTIVKSMS